MDNLFIIFMKIVSPVKFLRYFPDPVTRIEFHSCSFSLICILYAIIELYFYMIDFSILAGKANNLPAIGLHACNPIRFVYLHDCNSTDCHSPASIAFISGLDK